MTTVRANLLPPQPSRWEATIPAGVEEATISLFTAFRPPASVTCWDAHGAMRTPVLVEFFQGDLDGPELKLHFRGKTATDYRVEITP